MTKSFQNRNLATLVTDVISLGSSKFKDPDTGLEPNFMISLTLNRNSFLRGFYLPILNHWGFETFDYFTYNNGAIVLPWTHEDTWIYLTDSAEEDKVPSPPKLKGLEEWKAVVGGIRAGQVLFTKNSERVNANLIAGGTRTGIKLIRDKMRRPWQKEFIKHPLEGCPFCYDRQDNERVVGNLKVFDNLYTPYNWHKLIIPTRDFYQNKPREDYHLFNRGGLEEVLDLSLDIVNGANIKSAKLGVHKGYYAGQNIGHLHFHLLEPTIL